jgi:hypothetical protein
MAGMINDKWTWGVTYINLYYDDVSLASGSGFFWSLEGEFYLITNWHNLTGRDPNTLQPISKRGGLPNNVRFLIYEKTREEGDVFELAVREVRVELFEDFPFNSRFYVHPVHGHKVDVVALPLEQSLRSGRIILNTVETLEDDCASDPYVSQDVFIIGYPLGIITGLPVPIWKRGTIASEPMVDPNGLPLIYVDSATRKGMSGSVVVAERLHFGPYEKRDGTKTNTIMARTRNILGVYSGRLGADNVEAQLGIVWKQSVINEVIKGKITLETN